MPIYVIDIDSFDPLVLKGLPDGPITGSVKLRLPEVSIKVADPTGLFALALQDAAAYTKMRTMAIDMEGLEDIAPEDLKAHIAKIVPELQELSDICKRELEKEMRKLPEYVQEALIMQAIANGSV